MGRWVTHLIVLSEEPNPPAPDTIVFPSELIATELIGAECPSRFAFSLLDSASQTLQGGHSSMISTWMLMWKCDKSER